ncbi:S8 family serine peptidase [Nonlabens xiamenensis]|uniref:S8 family serine peptidase n=1 Tax=Nonlabens xiamenensis TaxID=2341043 RepID=UPI000F609BFA|nr:S8 family serine peptidase [Nonlabens xiamenensis]
MKKRKLIISIFVLALICSCNSQSFIKKESIKESSMEPSMLGTDSLKNWHVSSIGLNKLAGINLHSIRKFDYTEHKSVTVAVIDSEIDFKHDFLKLNIWFNPLEVPGNGIDDDTNGYIDDHSGWNFLGNLCNKNTRYAHFESTRILKELKNSNKSSSYEKLESLRSNYKKLLEEGKFNKTNNDAVLAEYRELQKEFDSILHKRAYDLKAIDSLKLQIKNDSLLFKRASYWGELLSYNMTEEYLLFHKKRSDSIYFKSLNLNYDDRNIQNDDSRDLNDHKYGTPLGLFDNTLNHGTQMAGIIVGIAPEKTKLMSLAISAIGDEHDKDIALAIRYAVDNGAKVINMSFWKHFSMHKEWVDEAIKYAADNDVVIISIAGNDGIDLSESFKYPDDINELREEFVDNFLTVGASSYTIDENLKPKYSNYGKNDVDIFAPGERIFTTTKNNGFTKYSDGTSSAAAVTSGVAALIRSYYPSLTAPEVKHILMESGVTYTVSVPTPTKENPERMTPFNELSKSGKILNAYNAIKMADSVVRSR